MGKQLEHPVGGLPCLTPSCKPAGWAEGGQRQEGGAWGRMEEEVFQQVFLASHNKLLECPCVLWIGSQQAMNQFSAEERRGALLWKVKVLLS